MKKNLFLSYGFLLLICINNSLSLFAQVDSQSNSLRHYVGQTKTSIINSFQYCHVETDQKTLTLTCDNDTYIIGIKAGMSFSIIYCPGNKGKAGTRFSSEIKRLKDSGWISTDQSTDEFGNIFYTYKKNDKCILCTYMPDLGWLSFQNCDK